MERDYRTPGGTRPPFHPQSSIRRRYTRAVQLAKEATCTFFGISPGDTQSTESLKWEWRRAELLRRRFGNARQPTEIGTASLRSDVADYVTATYSTTSRPHSLPTSRAYTVQTAVSTPAAASSLQVPTQVPLVLIQSATPPQRPQEMSAFNEGMTPISTASTTLAHRHTSLERTRKKSVSSMALDTFKQAVRRRPSSKIWDVVHDADSLPSPMDVLPSSVQETPMTPAAFVQSLVATPLEPSEFPTIPEANEQQPSDVVDAAPFHGLSVSLPVTSAERPARLLASRLHYQQQQPSIEDIPPPISASAEDLAEDLFYDLPRNYFVTRGMLDHCQPAATTLAMSHLSTIAEVASSTSSLPTYSASGDEVDLATSVLLTRGGQRLPSVFDDPDMVPKLSSLEGDVTDNLIAKVVERPERSALPFRLIAQCLGRNDAKQASSKKSKKGKRESTASTFDTNMLDSRAFFTYWITLVHIAIFLFSVISYGIAPIGGDIHTTQEMVLREWGVSQLVEYNEPENLWIGPSQASLVHLGARYAPCMRSDSNINKFLETQRESEEESGCCIRNDRTGCIQSTKTFCADALSTWLKWPNSLATMTSALSTRNSDSNVTRGPVCGLDPEYCLDPASVSPFLWPTNITQWPICTRQVPPEEIPEDVLHMQCDIIGRPCCVGLVGQCILTTREYCEFQKGYFHQEAFLCSQVACMGDVCGMIPFADEAKPDQFYRLWTSLFLHAGVFHLLISILLQMTIMRHLEKYAGWLRVALIYLLSGLVGNLASAIFTPYHAEAGPTGSHFGLIACLVVALIFDIVKHSAQYVSPAAAVLKIVVICLLLFAVGLLPFIDNWAHVFGFVFGAILSCMLLPDVEGKRLTRAYTVIICLTLSAGILAALVLLFYFFPVYECEACAYFNCIPFTSTFCATRRIQLPNLVKT